MMPILEVMISLLGVWLVFLVGWRLWQPHPGGHAGRTEPISLTPPLVHGSMILAEELRARGWREQMAEELSPEALERNAPELPGQFPFPRLAPDADPPPSFEFSGTWGSVAGAEYDDPEPAEWTAMPVSEWCAAFDAWGNPTDGLPFRWPSGDPPDEAKPNDLLSLMSDDDFWSACRFELRRLVFESYEPFALPGWARKMAAA